MQEKEIFSETDERIFTFFDCVDLFRRKKKRILQTAFICACLCLFFLLTRSPEYIAEASFKEGGIRESGTAGMADLLSSLDMGGRSDSQFSILMKSYPILKPLIGKLGLQAEVKQKGTLVLLYQKVRDNFKANGGKPIEEIDPFVFENVCYEGEMHRSFSLRFQDSNQFQLVSPNGDVAAAGRLGDKVSLPDLSFTLVRAPKRLRYRHSYPLTFAPWVDVARSLRGRLKIIPNKQNRSIFDLSITSRNRQEAVALLNQWVQQYLDYLKKDHDEIDQQHISYLQGRQEQICDRLKLTFDQYTDFLSKNLQTNGCTGFENELEQKLAPLQEISHKLFAIEIELLNFPQIGIEENSISNNFMPTPYLSGISKEIQNLKQQRDLISASIDRDENPLQVSLHLENLKEIRRQKDAAERLKKTVSAKEPIWDDFVFEPQQALVFWAKGLVGASEKEREDFAEYLENHVRILSVREKIFQERFFNGQNSNLEFQGIDLETAKALFMEYNRKLDDSEATIRHFEMLKKEIGNRDFEFSSLSTVLEDKLSCALIARATDILLNLKDDKHHSSKEAERWQEELSVQKKILGEHLEQLLKVEELNFSLVKEKIQALRQVTVDCLNQKISVLYEQSNDHVKERKETLLKEKELLEQKAKEIRLSVAKLPESWREEKWLDFKVELGTKMMRALSEIIEAKTIGHHLARLESKPLNHPTLPVSPICPRLFVKSFACGIVGGGGFFFLALIGVLFQGFPSSAEKLKAMRFPCLGEISSFSDGASLGDLTPPDLHQIRQIAFSLKQAPQAKLVSLILGKGPDYSGSLIENLARTSRRCLLLRCDFNSTYHAKLGPGLLQFLQGEISDLPLQQKNGYLWVQSGGYAPFSSELLEARAFQELLFRLRESKNYDQIFLLFRSPLESMDSIGALSFCDRAIITVCQEKAQTLTPFADWSYHKGCHRAIFITSDAFSKRPQKQKA